MPGEMLLCMKCMSTISAGDKACANCGYPVSSMQEKNYLPEGLAVKGRYIVGKLIKKTIDSAVYIGYDIQFKKVVEIREFFPKSVSKREKDSIHVLPEAGFEENFKQYRQSFEQLWRNLMRFKGLPALFDVNDVFSLNSTVYAVTEHEDSTTFGKILNQIDIENRPLSFEKTRELILSILTTIESLHTAGVLHRGISPETLLLSSDGKMKLTGFAIPQVRTAKNKVLNQVFDGYSAIEQYDFNWQQGAWTDIYSIGAVIYKMLTGRTVETASKRMTEETVLFTEEEQSRIPSKIISLIKNSLILMPQGRIKEVRTIIDTLSFDIDTKNGFRSGSVLSALPNRDRRLKKTQPVHFEKPKQASAPAPMLPIIDDEPQTIQEVKDEVAKQIREIYVPPKRKSDEKIGETIFNEGKYIPANPPKPKQAKAPAAERVNNTDIEDNKYKSEEIDISSIERPKQAKAPDTVLPERKDSTDTSFAVQEEKTPPPEIVKPKQAKAPVIEPYKKPQEEKTIEEIIAESKREMHGGVKPLEEKSADTVLPERKDSTDTSFAVQEEKTPPPEIVKPKQAKAPVIEPYKKPQEEKTIEEIIAENKSEIQEIFKPKQAKAPEAEKPVQVKTIDEIIAEFKRENQIINKPKQAKAPEIQKSASEGNGSLQEKSIEEVPEFVIKVKSAVPEIVKPSQAEAETKTVQPQPVTVDETARLLEKQRREEEQREHDRQIREKEEREEKIRQEQLEFERELREEKRQLAEEKRKQKWANSPLILSAGRAKDSIGRKLEVVRQNQEDKKKEEKYPVLIGLKVALSISLCGIFIIVLLYSTVLFKVFDAPVLDNFLSSFSFLPINNQEPVQDIKMVEVADFTNLTREYVESDVNLSKRYTFLFEYDYSKTVKKGYICRQSVATGEKVPEGTVITLYISKGVKKITMVDVTGKTYDEAYGILTEIGFTVEKQQVYNIGFHHEGEVISSTLDAGQKYKDGKTVTLRVWGPVLTPVEESTGDVTQSTAVDGNQNVEESTSSAAPDTTEQIGSIVDRLRSMFGF